MKKFNWKKWALIAGAIMLAVTFYYGAFQSLKTDVSDWLIPATTATPAE